MFKKFFKNEKGLTLVELLAVIVILGIVAAIAVPSIGSVIQKSRENAVKADAIAVLNGAKTYVAENGVPAEDLDEEDLEDYVDNAKLGAYTVSITEDGKTFALTTDPITVGKITITFEEATVTDINSDDKYGDERPIPPAAS